MLPHYQILSSGQYLIPEVLDVNERCFASGPLGARSTSRGLLLAFVGEYQRQGANQAEVRDKALSQGWKYFLFIHSLSHLILHL